MADEITIQDYEDFPYRLLKYCGIDVRVSNRAYIRRPSLVSLGNHVGIDAFNYITTGADIGDYVHLASSNTFIGHNKTDIIKMEHFTGMSSGNRIIVSSDEWMGEGLVSPIPPEEFRDKQVEGGVTFKMFSGITSNVVINPGVTLGMGSVVGACSFVTEDTEPWVIYYGVPARPVKERRRDKMIEYAKRLGYEVPGY